MKEAQQWDQLGLEQPKEEELGQQSELEQQREEELGQEQGQREGEQELGKELNEELAGELNVLMGHCGQAAEEQGQWGQEEGEDCGLQGQVGLHILHPGHWSRQGRTQ